MMNIHNILLALYVILPLKLKMTNHEQVKINIEGLKPITIGTSRGFVIPKNRIKLKSGCIYDIEIKAIHQSQVTDINIKIEKVDNNG